MSRLVNEYNELWAFHYLGEAIAEYRTASSSKQDAKVRDHVAASVRGTQLSIHHTLGAPEHLELVASSSLEEITIIKNLKPKFVAGIALPARHVLERIGSWNRETLRGIGGGMASIVSSITEELTGSNSLYVGKDTIRWLDQ